MTRGKAVKVRVSAGGVVLNTQGQVLVVSQNNNSWSLPKGHLDKGETLEQAARREIREESGLTKLKLLRELGTYERPRIAKSGQGEDRSEIKRITLFLYTTTQTELKPLDPRNPEALWVGRTRVAGLLTHAKDRSFFRGIIKELPKERP